MRVRDINTARKPRLGQGNIFTSSVHGGGGWLPNMRWEGGFASQHALGNWGGWLRVVRILLECFLVSIALMNIFSCSHMRSWILR